MKVIKDVFPACDDIDFEQSETPKFVDSGGNFEKVICPKCEMPIDNNWWQEAMDGAHNTAFSNLDVIVPCCKSKLSLNDLKYDWPSGFAKFIIASRNPNRDIQEDEMQKIEQILGISIRKIWTHC